MKFHAVIEKQGVWYVGYVVEVPGVNAQEKTVAAVRKSLLSALKELVEIDRDAVFRKKAKVEELILT